MTKNNVNYTLSIKINGFEKNLDNFDLEKNSTAIFTLFIKEYNNDSETLVLNTVCDKNSYPLKFKLQAKIGEDSLFNQIIFDKKFNKTQNICYKVAGDDGQLLHVFSLPKKNIKVFSKFRNDNYFSEISLQIGNGHIEVTVNAIFLSFYSRLEWNEVIGKNWMEYEYFVYKMKKDSILFKINKKEKITFEVKRSINSKGKYFLMIIVNGLSTNYSSDGGLIGKIGNNEISIYPPIGREEKDGRTVVINGFLSIGYEKIINGSSCIFIDVNHLLSPFKLNQYVFS